ncbi:hypothetical protein DFH28DRAFT_884515, partial [Melampsora americana]
GTLVSINHHKLDLLCGRTHLTNYLIYALIAPVDIKGVIEKLRPHCINSFEKFLFPGISNVENLVKWGIELGMAMDFFSEPVITTNISLES